MNLNQSLKNNLKKIRSWPQKTENYFYKNFPEIFGHQVIGSPVQLYIHDDKFTTALSFNHFVEFFSNLPKMSLQIKIEAFDRHGKSLGVRLKSLEEKGSFQLLLSDLYPRLDSYGLFSVGMQVKTKFSPDLAYLGALFPQYMTVFIPKDNLSSAQMIHSHKLRQGKILISRNLRRMSSNIETSIDIKANEIYFLNSSSSTLKAQADAFSGNDGRLLKSFPVKIPGYGVSKINLDPQALKSDFYRFEYQFDRNVDHKKPIIFRQFADGSWSCNHT